MSADRPLAAAAEQAAAVIAAAEQRGAERERAAIAAEVAQLRADRTSLASMWIVSLPPGPLEQVLPADPDAMRLLGGGLLDVTGDDIGTSGLIVYMRDLLARMLADAQAAAGCGLGGGQ
jgi:hypothetical protein